MRAATSWRRPSTVTVTGPQRELAGIEARVTVEPQHAEGQLPGRSSRCSSYDAKGVRLNNVGVQPADISVSIDITAVVTPKIVAVFPRTEGSPSPGPLPRPESWSVPLTVVVTGSQDLLNTLDSVSTQPISLNGVFGTFTHHGDPGRSRPASPVDSPR